MLQTSVWSPLSIRNCNNAWKFPERLVFCGSTSRGPLRTMLFFPQKIIVLQRDFKISRFLLICCWVSCWSVDQLGAILLSYFSEIPPLQSLQNYASHISRSRVWWNVKWRTSKVWVETCTICLVYSSFAHTRLQKKKTHGKQNAPSRYLASQGNLFSHLHTKWRLEIEHSTDTGKSIAHLVSTHSLWTWACPGPNMSRFPWKPSQYRTENSPPSDKLDRLEPWFINQNLVFLRSKLKMNSNRNSTRTNEGTSRERLSFIYDCQ